MIFGRGNGALQKKADAD